MTSPTVSGMVRRDIEFPLADGPVLPSEFDGYGRSFLAEKVGVYDTVRDAEHGGNVRTVILSGPLFRKNGTLGEVWGRTSWSTARTGDEAIDAMPAWLAELVEQHSGPTP